VHFGKLSGYEGRTVWLTNSRRLWSWSARAGVALSGVAVHGLETAKSKLDAQVPAIVLLDACEIIDASEACVATMGEDPSP
jgi:hypothetical protein